jgi:thiopeptide-type bacteriocin biosynthesis protein
VIGDELVMESRSLKKVIIPRLASAFNYGRNNLALFRLLCDLQYQGVQGSYTLDLEQYFPGMAHYPRVVYKQTILCAAVWHLSAQELRELKEAGPTEAVIRFKVLRDKLKIPAVIALSRFDQQLVFNLDREDEVVFLLDCLKLADKAVLQEFFLPAGRAVVKAEKPLVNQFVAFLYREETVYPGTRAPEPVARRQVGKEYILGSRWLYLKLYCLPAIANDLLVKKLLPLLTQFKQPDLLSWFFIRYHDAGYHIRLRLEIREPVAGDILAALKKRLAETVRYHLIREYQADTYRREMERYGPDMIEPVEAFFYGSSELVIRYIKVAGRRSFPYSYHSLAFVSVSYLLDRFMAVADDRVAFLEQMVHTFYAEFATDKSLKIGLDQKFRELKAEINRLLGNGGYYKSLDLEKWADLYAVKIAGLLKKAALFKPKRRMQLLADLVHMHLNRLFVDRQRNQELIVYYCLYKHQLSVNARQKKHN